MFKKIGISLVFLLTFATFAIAEVDNKSKTPDIVGYSQYRNGVSTTMFRIDHEGDLIPGLAQAQDLGSSTHPWNNIYCKAYWGPRGVNPVHEMFTNVAATNYQGLGAFSISTTALVANGTAYATQDLIQPDYPRNIIVFSSWMAGTSTATVSGTVVVIGSDSLGNLQTETLTLVSTPNATVGIGSVTWATISTITISNVTIGTGTTTSPINICIGTGLKLGLSWHIVHNYDVFKVTENGANISSETINATFNSYQPATAPTGSLIYNVWYKFNKTP